MEAVTPECFFDQLLVRLDGSLLSYEIVDERVLEEPVAALLFPDIHLGLYDCKREEQI